MNHQRGNISPRIIIGVAIIIFAILLFLNNIGLNFLWAIIGNWPLALIIIGGALLFNQKSSQNYNAKLLPYFLIGAGVLFLLMKYHVLNFSIGAIIGPLILLYIGMHILRPAKRKYKRFSNDKNHEKKTFYQEAEESEVIIEAEYAAHKTGETHQTEQTDNCYSRTRRENTCDDDRIDIFAVLGGGNFDTRSTQLTGGNVVTILGGASIDMREADMQGDTIELEVVAFMGGTEIKIPPNWHVSVKLLPILGAVTNKTTCLAEKMGLPKKQLIITGLAFMGGLEIRN